MNIMPFFVMSDLQAARFREETAGDQNRLEPRLVDAGLYKGRYVLPERVMEDPAHEARHDALRMLTVVAIDIEAAWPATGEEE